MSQKVPTDREIADATARLRGLPVMVPDSELAWLAAALRGTDQR